MSDNVNTSFKLPADIDKALPLLAEIHGFEGKSAYIRHLIAKDIEEQQKKADLYTQLIGHVGGSSQYDPVLQERDA